VVVSPSGKVGGKPAFDQLIAREVERIPDQGCCAWTNAENIDVMPKRAKNKRAECFI